ncbi:MAG: tRNA (guanosine(46)-N7)-methyltransferase TrmB [Nitrospinota bacterium]|nr:tRNA (guanosine(46)-N7)-methyltransferase TrmB [Nitrospinota bacterium]
MIIFEYPVFNGRNGKIDLRELFPDAGKPFKVEIGFGNGVFIFDKALEESDTNFIGIELYHRGIRSLAKKIKKADLKNIIIIYADAKKVFSGSIRDNELAEIYINFPDPWPKKRHKKRRLVNIDFAQLVYSKLKNKGTVYLATDSEDYIKEMLVSFEGKPGFINLAGRLKYSEKKSEPIVTKYEGKSLSNGKENYYLQFQLQK